MEGNEPTPIPQEDTKIVDGIKYIRVWSGFTIRQFYSHHTDEMGSGPGWDFKEKILEKYGVNDPSELPDEPYYIWEEVRE